MMYSFAPDNQKKILGQIIKTEREALGMSKKALSEELGIGRKAVEDIENGNNKAFPRIENLLNMCNLFDCELDYLLGFQPTRRKVVQDISKETGLSVEACEVLSEYVSHQWYRNQPNKPEKLWDITGELAVIDFFLRYSETHHIWTSLDNERERFNDIRAIHNSGEYGVLKKTLNRVLKKLRTDSRISTVSPTGEQYNHIYALFFLELSKVLGFFDEEGEDPHPLSSVYTWWQENVPCDPSRGFELLMDEENQEYRQSVIMADFLQTAKAFVECTDYDYPEELAKENRDWWDEQLEDRTEDEERQVLEMVKTVTKSDIEELNDPIGRSIAINVIDELRTYDYERFTSLKNDVLQDSVSGNQLSNSADLKEFLERVLSGSNILSFAMLNELLDEAPEMIDLLLERVIARTRLQTTNESKNPKTYQFYKAILDRKE